jgi:hypothetical protein
MQRSRSLGHSATKEALCYAYRGIAAGIRAWHSAFTQ